MRGFIDAFVAEISAAFGSLASPQHAECAEFDIANSSQLSAMQTFC